MRLGRTFESVEFLSGDNTAVNPRLANLITAFLATKNIIRTIPLVGYAAHRLNLGVQQFFQPTTATYHDHVYMVNKLMVSLGTLKNRARLQAVTPLAPIRLHEIRWAGVRNSIRRFQEIDHFLRSASLPQETRLLFIRPELNEEITEFASILEDCHKVSLHLQSNDANINSMRRARQAFDALAKKYPSMAEDLKKGSKHVHCPDFENGIVKLQNDDEGKLRAGETKH